MFGANAAAYKEAKVFVEIVNEMAA